MTSVSRIVGLLALLGTSIGACGARTGLDVPKRGVETEVESDGGTCTASNVTVEPNVPNLYFVLDISTSMLNGKKWDNIRPAVANLIVELGANARFAAWVFPDTSHGGCWQGKEIMPLRLGDAQGATAGAFMAAVATINPSGGTPTAATFQALLPVLQNLPGTTFVILATDGGPNCDSNINTCPIDQCTSNIDMANPPTCNPGVPPNCCDPTPSGNTMAGTGCLDGDATAQAVRDLRAAEIRTYVMGIPGSAPYASVLDQLAVAGGTARYGEPRYYAVNSSDEAALGSGFQQIAAAAMRSCVLTLHDTVTDPNKVNVYVDGAVVPNGPDGWSLQRQTITLQGMTCAQFGMGTADAGTAPVRVTQGCPTVR
jgi:hypothetical protein